MKKYYKIAGLIVGINSFGRTVEQAKAYLLNSSENYDIVVTSTWNEIKEKYPHLADEDGEYISTGANFYKQLLNFDGLMLHSSAVVVDGKAYLFSADPGTGKSTHTQLWLTVFGSRAFILNDDKPALRLQEGTWYAYGTPWSGKHDISVNTGVPVAGIAMIERSEHNAIAPFDGKEAIFSVYRQVNRPQELEYRAKLLELLDKLISQVPIWKLKCNMEPEAARLSYAVMSGMKTDKGE